MERDFVLNGIHIGEHNFEPEKVIDEIYERCVKPGFNFVTIRPRYHSRDIDVPQHYFIEWAKYLAEHKIYFIFLYTVQFTPEDRESLLDADTVTKMRDIAGEYFIGDMIGEVGSSRACKHAGYFRKSAGRADPTQQKLDYADMKEAHEGYVKGVSEYINVDKKLNVPEVVSVEATGLNKYNAEAGVTIPMLELMCGNPDILVSSLRGTARAIDSKMWGTYVAHEWYGGMRHADTLKRKRLELAYKYAYLAGTNVFCLESGDECLESYGDAYDKDSEICHDYQNVLKNTMELIRRDERPKGGPKAKVAFVSGLHDAWGGWGGSSVWNQFHRKEWGHSDAEYSWRLLDEIGAKRQWTDIANFGEHDFSAYPAYGMYDIVPIEADVEHLLRYDYLIFLGWNSMTDENMDKLTEYVNQGGNLLMSVAHLNYSTVRGGTLTLPSNEKLKKLFGCRYTGEVVNTNAGIKFKFTSVNEDVLYPGTKDLVADPIYSAGYVNWAKFELCGGVETAVISDSFANVDLKTPAVIEHKVGQGTATLVTSTNYPGNGALYPLYRAMMREFITASSRKCEIRVLGNDRLRWAVYDNHKVYLLNTDYDMPITVKVIYKDKEQTLTLDSLELKSLEM